MEGRQFQKGFDLKAMVGLVLGRYADVLPDPEGLDGGRIRYRAVGSHDPATLESWLPSGPVTVGLTAGASTPNNVAGEVVEKLLALRGRTSADLEAAR